MRKLIDIIPQEFRWRGVWVATTLLVRAVLNLAGLAMLLPVLVLVLDPRSVVDGGSLEWLYQFSGAESLRMFAIMVCVAVVGLIALKCLVVLVLAQAERRYIYDLYTTLSRRLYIAYHNRGLAYIKQSNSAVLARNVNVVCLQFTAGVLKPVAAIVADVLFFVLLFAALVAYAPLGAALAVAVFMPGVWIYYTLIRNRINRYGELENRAQREKARIVSETFRGFADIEISAAFPKMLRSFERAMREVVVTRLREASIAMLPPALTEIALALGMALLITLTSGEDDAQLLFGVFAVAALRLMPSVRSILSSWTTLRYNRYAVDTLGESLSDNDAVKPVESTTEKLPFEHRIEVRGLAFRYDEDSEEIFRDFSLEIRKGERLGIRGSSGAGKTTLFNLMLGLYEPTGGEILIDGVRLTSTNRRAWQNRIGYVSQNLFLVDGTFAENVALGVVSADIDRERVAEALRTAHLEEFISTLPNGMDTRIGECGCRLSGGQRQRIGIARALYRRSDVLFFDEATSALDNQTEEEINRSIMTLANENNSLTIVTIAHRETTLEYCDRIITLDRQ